ncbi:MAG: hypothetical protein RLZZ127_135 [Planctomycetota bacterium]|jgi:prepilin-type N-terminal cleavage/methylation domain-containing protein
MSRRGTTLVELIIAIAILGTVMVATMQFSMSARQYAATAAAQDELAEDLGAIARVLGRDAIISGWALSATASFAGGNALPAAVADDRAAAYFPYVIVYGGSAEDEAVAGGRFAHARIPAALLPDQAAIADAVGSAPDPAAGWDEYRRSPVGPSHGIVMLALQQGAWSAGMRVERGEALGFGAADDSDLALWRTPGSHDALKILQSSPYEEIYDTGSPTGQFQRLASAPATGSYGIVPGSMALTELDGQFAMLPQWETMDPPTYDGSDGRDPDGTEHFTGWREYLYAVVRPPASVSGRLGRLVRARKVLVDASLVQGTGTGELITDPSQTYGFVVDKVLSDNVVRLIAETRRSAPAFVSPAVDQVRFIVSLVRPVENQGRSGQRIPRQGTITVGMRTAASGIIRSATTLTPDAAIPVHTHPAYPVAP